jgi:hypothetical protein
MYNCRKSTGIFVLILDFLNRLKWAIFPKVYPLTPSFQIPYHLDIQTKSRFALALESFFEKKEVKRTIDYRTSLVRVVLWDQRSGLMPDAIGKAIRALSEISRILYEPEDSRTTASVLRLNNQCLLLRISLLDR